MLQQLILLLRCSLPRSDLVGLGSDVMAALSHLRFFQIVRSTVDVLARVISDFGGCTTEGRADLAILLTGREPSVHGPGMYVADRQVKGNDRNLGASMGLLGSEYIHLLAGRCLSGAPAFTSAA